MTGVNRNIAPKIEKLLDVFPVVLLIGARQTGKTTLSKALRPDWQYFDLENSNDYDLISRDYDFFFTEYPRHLIIDEAQENPALFRHLRGVIDAKRDEKGRFILTGSSSPELLTQASDSLAGRIAIIEVGTLKVNEILEQPLPAFYQLFAQPIDADAIEWLKTLSPITDDVMPWFLRGGYPEPVLAENDFAWSTWMENYYRTYINRDVKRLFPKLDGIRYRRFVNMLAALSGTVINKAQLGRSIDVSEVTIRDYLDIADKTYVWRTIPSYENTPSKSLLKMPKGQWRDSGLMHYLLGVENRKALLRLPQVGHSFESFVIEEMIKGIQATAVTRWDTYFYRTKNGAEVDLVLEGSFGVLPVEVKFGQTTTAKQLAGLQRFLKDNDLPLGLVVNNANEVKVLAEGIVQIPAGCI